MPGLEVKVDTEKLENVNTITKAKQETNLYTKAKANSYDIGIENNESYINEGVNAYKVDGNTYVSEGIETDTENAETETILEKNRIQYYTYLFVKRVFDIVGSVLGIVVLIPVTLVIATTKAILKENDGPLFYEQLRVGKNGKVFRMYKFRTMCIDADEKLRVYLLEHKDEENALYYKKYKKLKDDPRVTKFGRFLRKTSIDELPQVINVLKGDMSLVEPRPYLPREKEDMGEYYDCIIQSRPGVTGYWQIAGRNDVTFEDRLRMDYEYNKKKSLKTDLKLLAKTVLKVVKKEGAI